MGPDAPPPPDGYTGSDAPPPPDGYTGSDAPPPPDGYTGSGAPPPPDGYTGAQEPPSVSVLDRSNDDGTQRIGTSTSPGQPSSVGKSGPNVPLIAAAVVFVMVLAAVGGFAAFTTFFSTSDSGDDAAPEIATENSESSKPAEVPAEEPAEDYSPDDTTPELLPQLTNDDLTASLDQIPLDDWEILIEPASVWVPSESLGYCGGPNSHRRALNNWSAETASAVWINDFNESFRIDLYTFPSPENAESFINETLMATQCGYFEDLVRELAPGEEAGSVPVIDWLKDEGGFDWNRTSSYLPLTRNGRSADLSVEADSWWHRPGTTVPSLAERIAMSYYQVEDVVVVQSLRGICCFDGTDNPSYDSLPDANRLELLADDVVLELAVVLGRSSGRQ